MKIYILRHEDRTLDATFFAPLTYNGHLRSQKLVSYLRENQINKIYSSPFVRTLQTVNPYLKYLKSKNKNLKVNLDYGLSEIQHPHIIPEKSYKINLPIYIAKDFNYNEKYQSSINPEDFKYPENGDHVKNRVKNIFNKIFDDNIDSKANVLIVTHQIICNLILQMVSKEFKDMEINLSDSYPTGGLTLIFDTDQWEFEQINW